MQCKWLAAACGPVCNAYPLLLQYLEVCNILHLPPRCLVVNSDGALNLAHYGIGDRTFSAVAAALPLAEHKSIDLNLAHNSLTDEACVHALVTACILRWCAIACAE